MFMRYFGVPAYLGKAGDFGDCFGRASSFFFQKASTVYQKLSKVC